MAGSGRPIRTTALLNVLGSPTLVGRNDASITTVPHEMTNPLLLVLKIPPLGGGEVLRCLLITDIVG